MAKNYNAKLALPNVKYLVTKVISNYLYNVSTLAEQNWTCTISKIWLLEVTPIRLIEKGIVRLVQSVGQDILQLRV